MEAKDLGDKKINHEELNEGFSTENLPKDYNPASKLKPELETDEDGNKSIVNRARHTQQTTPHGNNNNSGLHADETVEKKMVENKDRNSDITANRYPNSHPDNHINRGNIDLGE